MSAQLVVLGIVGLLSLAGCSSSDPSSEGSPAPQGGGWETSFGRMDFAVEGDKFQGTYDGDSGTIAGTVDGPQVVGEWYESLNSRACDEERGGTVYWGTFTFVFAADDTSFDGTWGYCGDAEDDVWTGELKPGDEPS